MKATVTVKDGISTWSAPCPDCGRTMRFSIPAHLDDYSAVNLRCEHCEDDVDEVGRDMRKTGRKVKQKRRFIAQRPKKLR